MTADETFTALCRSIVAGVHFPDWVVTTSSGRMAGLVSRVPAGVPPYSLWRAVRSSTLDRLTGAGLIVLGEEGLVPEYGGGGRGLEWSAGRGGRRLVVTEAGKAAAGMRWPY